MYFISYLKTSEIVAVEAKICDLGGNPIHNRFDSDRVLHTLVSKLKRFSSDDCVEKFMNLTIEQSLMFYFDNSSRTLDTAQRTANERTILFRLTVEYHINRCNQLLCYCCTIIVDQRCMTKRAGRFVVSKKERRLTIRV